LSLGEPSVARDRRAIKILYIEDNPENRMLARAVLEAEGYTVLTADDGLSGIEAAIREQPNLILLDVNLPGVDGYEAVAILKSFPDLATTPVIAVTAYAMEGDRQRTLVAGCDGYIQKPIDVDAFPSQVGEFLRGKRERVEEREEGLYLRELNQRLVYRLLGQVEELKRVNEHFVRRARQLEDLHRAVQDVTSELGVTTLLERLLPGLARALGSRNLVVELTDPSGVRVEVAGEGVRHPRSVLAGSGRESADEWSEVEWRFPLMVRGRSLGELAARHALPPGAKADEEQLLKIVSNQVAIAVENARLYEETRLRLGSTETLLAVSQAVGATLDTTETMRRVARETARALGADTVGACLADPEGRTVRAVAGYHVPKHLALALQEMTVSVRDSRFLTEAWRARGARFSSEAAADPLITPAIYEKLRYRSILFAPMMIQERPIGGLFLIWWIDRHEFTAEEVRVVEGICRQAAMAVENARLHEGVKHQMDELKHTQAQLVQSAKLAAIGELAANVAHEINNPLTTVLGFASYLGEKVDAADPMREELKLIQEEAGRARDIVRDLLDFSRQHDFSPEPADLNNVLERTVAMVKRQRALKHVQLQEQYAPDLPLVEIDVSRMKQVFLNIINNALYAMADAGTLTIRTGSADGRVHVDFVDTGTGIAPEHLDRIFDPFFTTKPEVSGTGLGLSVSLGIVQSHGGTIDVKSAPGQGATFTVKLPARAAGGAPDGEGADRGPLRLLRE
jgi:signal transduction histidine kinase/DNA-binding response OmpR family regulator